MQMALEPKHVTIIDVENHFNTYEISTSSPLLLHRNNQRSMA